MSGPWGHQAVHLAVLRGDDVHHSKVMSWYQGRLAKLYGWNPSGGVGGASCSTFPDDQFAMLPLDTAIAASTGLISAGHSTLPNGDLLISGGTGPGHAGSWQAFILRRNEPLGQQWAPLSNMNLERLYHASTTLGDGDVLVHGGPQYFQMAFHGGAADPENPATVRGDIQRLALTAEGRWLSTPTPVFGPSAREGHSAVTLGRRGQVDTTLVFGGRNATGQVLADTWAWFAPGSVDTMDWDATDASNSPPARFHHTAVLTADRRMIVYGGQGVNGSARSDVRELRPPLGALSWRWSPSDINPGGPEDPGARYGHAAIYDGAEGRNRMLVFGGSRNGGLADDDLYALDLTTMAWSRPPLTLPGKPSAREGHSWTLDPHPRSGPFTSADRRAVLFGGRTGAGPSHEVWVLWISPTGALRWEQRAPSGPPSGRSRHSAVWDESFAPNLLQDRLLIHGGDTGGATNGELWALDFNLAAWTELSAAGLARAGHVAAFRTSPLVALYAERYSVATGQWALEGEARLLPTHPNMFLLPSGNVFFAGPGGATALYKTVGPMPRWSPLGTSGVDGIPAVLLHRSSSDQAVEIMKCGGYSAASRSTARITILPDDTAPVGWQTQSLLTPDTLMARMDHNLVVLPTGKVLATGGRRAHTDDHSDADTLSNPGVRQPQVWDPDAGPAGSWSGRGVLAEDPALRGFHSTAALLPDGRVLSLGGDPPGAFRFLATLYCPPYLFNPGGSLARRPSIAAWHDSAGYDMALPIWTESPDSIVSVCLIRPGAVTHSHNQDQRYLRLEFQVVSRAPELGCPAQELVAVTPAHANLAPPGDYLLFIVKRSPFDTVAPADTVVPSVGQWLRLRAGGLGPKVGSPPSTCEVVASGGHPPLRFALHQNQPNPFAGRTVIRFDLPTACDVKLEIFDLLGRRVRTLSKGRYGPGRHTVLWDLRDDRGLPARAGMFAYRLSAGVFQDQRLLIALR